MNSNAEKQIDAAPIVIDDADIIDEPNIESSSCVIAKDKPVQYDNSKIASTCLGQFFINYNIGTRSALCLICGAAVKKSGDSTFNFIRHVKRHHLTDFKDWRTNLEMKEENIRLKQSSIKNSMMSPRGTKYHVDHPRQKELSKMVTNDLIIGLGLPLSIVERPEFLRAMLTVDSKFVVPSRRSVCRDILPKAVHAIENHLKAICKSSRFVSLTLDAWTDRRMRCFYGVTIHLINENQFKSHLLAFKSLSGMFFRDSIYLLLCYMYIM